MNLSKNTTALEHQPKGLYLIFFTGLWERFGFYTLQTIIILYMTKSLLMPDADANLLYAAFSSLLYITPIIGGYLADRYLGFKQAIFIGGLLFILAYFLCASPNKSVFFLGLSILICANGLFKPSISSIVGDLYEHNDSRRDAGFTLFYMGINIGALIPPLIAGTLVKQYGWHAGFFLAAVGMIIGIIIFIWGRKYLNNIGMAPNIKNFSTRRTRPIFYFLLFIGIIAFMGLCEAAFYYPQIINSLMIITTIAILFTVCFFTLREPKENRKKLLAAIILIAISVGFWSLYNQTFTSLMLFADRNMDPQILGIHLHAEGTQFFNPFFIILLSPFLSKLWIRMDHSGLNPSIQMKFSLGVFFLSLGFLLLAVGTNFFGYNGTTSAWWLCFSYLLQTIGELLISPIGLAMITVLCPKHLVGFDMSGNRLGRGGGYYDFTFSFLKNNRGKPLLIGLGFEVQQAIKIPTDEWDIQLDGILTEKKFLIFDNAIQEGDKQKTHHSHD